MTKLDLSVIDTLPDVAWRKGPRDSDALRAAEKARSEIGKVVRITGTPAEIDRFYRSMLQWKRRNTEYDVAVRKDGDTVYVWVPTEANPDNPIKRGSRR